MPRRTAWSSASGRSGIPTPNTRVYWLTGEHWAGLWVASRYVTGLNDDPTTPSGEYRQLLGLGPDAHHAVQLTVDFFNWDLEAHGEHWRLSAIAPPADGRRPEALNSTSSRRGSVIRRRFPALL